MKKEIFIFCTALVIFAAYLDWLLIQPRHVVAQLKASPPSPHVQFKQKYVK